MVDSTRITTDSLVDLIFHLKWKSDVADHTDCYHARRVNIWRDLIPTDLMKGILNKTVGDSIVIPTINSDILPSFSKKKLFDLRSDQFNCRSIDGSAQSPRTGRFYPKGKLKGLSNIFSTNVQPFRCVGFQNGHMTVDFNNPLSQFEPALSALVAGVENKDIERGGTSVDWMETLTSGPGMQARWRGLQTNFISDDSFHCQDKHPDSEFYQEERIVHHLDATAREMVINTYNRFLKDGMRVLDLMSSWESHLPGSIYFDKVVGLGLNEQEMKRNPDLSDFMVHDLNADSSLQFNSNSFDAVINTASVEYLTDPVKIFEEVWRILRPNGYFIVTFSNRWFPTKAISIWSELHEFERMGLVLEYFSSASGYEDLHTYSIRGLPRPYDDKYFPESLLSDPIYAVWGRKK